MYSVYAQSAVGFGDDTENQLYLVPVSTVQVTQFVTS